MPTSSIGRKNSKLWVNEALLAGGKQLTTRQTIDWIKVNRPVPISDFATLTKRGDENVFCREIRFARIDLKAEGIIHDRAGRGIWTLC